MLTGANKEKKGPKRRVWRRLGRFVGSSPRQPAARHPLDPLCPTPPPTSLCDSLDGSPGLHLPYIRPPSALHPASIWRPPPPTSPRDSLVASSASICPTPGLHLPPHHHQRVLMTRWWLPRPPSALHHHQRVLATRWTVPPASLRLPTTTTEPQP